MGLGNTSTQPPLFLPQAKAYCSVSHSIYESQLTYLPRDPSPLDSLRSLRAQDDGEAGLLPEFIPTMKRLMDILQMRVRHMGVNLRRSDIGVAEHFLDRPQIRPLH